MDGENETRTYRAEIVVRSLAPHGINERQRAIIERVESFEEPGVLKAVEIEVWAKRSGPIPTSAPRPTHAMTPSKRGPRAGSTRLHRGSPGDSVLRSPRRVSKRSSASR
jgi:hypothetical protein